MDFNLEQAKDLISHATNKDYFDYTIQLANIATPIILMFVTWGIFIKTPKQNKIIVINEKEIEMLYKAFENFHIFSDAISLYISNKKRKHQNELDGKNLEVSFTQKETESSNAVYESFRNYTLAISILRSIGDKNTESFINKYHEKAKSLRTSIYDFELNKGYDKNELKTFVNDIVGFRKELETLKEKCFDSISSFKDEMKK